jgi:hypothetical protein
VKREAKNKPMRISMFVLFLSSICGLAHARLGETYQQIESRYGKLEEDSDTCMTWDMDYCRGVVRKMVREKDGFNKIYFYFLRVKSELKCSNVKYLKFYKNINENIITPVDVRRLLRENYHQEAQLMKIKESKGIDGDKVINSWWRASWKGPNGEEAQAAVEMGPWVRPQISIRCSAPEWTTFVEKQKKTPTVLKEKNKTLN